MRYEVIKPKLPEPEIVLHMSPDELGFLVRLLENGTLYERCTQISRTLNTAYDEIVL